MPVINFELSDEDTVKLDAIAKNQMRARKYTVAVLIKERIAQIEAEDKSESMEVEP